MNAAERAERAYREGEAGRPYPEDAGDRERRIWRLAFSRHLAGGNVLLTTKHRIKVETDGTARALLALLDTIAVEGDLTPDESAERDRLKARLRLA